MLFNRKGGILLHISSLPSKYGIGDIGYSAIKFIDFLSNAGISLWQILPIGPTSHAFQNSPYHSLSSFAGNFIFIDPQKLFEKGYISDKTELETIHQPNSDKIDYYFAYKYKRSLLKKAFESSYEKIKSKEKFEAFCRENAFWLEDYALLQAIRTRTRKEWHQCDENIKFRKDIQKLKESMKEQIEFFKFEQFVFFEQWFELKKYANSKGVLIIGDVPIYPSYDSCDVWANPEIFKLNKDLNPISVAGVPPDFFSSTGQLWGNPVYEWDKLEETNFEFWLKKISFYSSIYDIIRLDHFRGFIAYWEVPFGEKTAVNGRWCPAPAEKFFKKVLEIINRERIIVEDLGFITNDVRYIRDKLGFAGMKVLEFAFYDKNSEHLPHNYTANSVCYIGTHDNPPTKLWFRQLDDRTKKNLFSYIGREISDEDEITWELIRLALSSVSKFAIIQMQDLIGSTSRMNTPATEDGNWLWKIPYNLEYERVAEKVRTLCNLYGRL